MLQTERETKFVIKIFTHTMEDNVNLLDNYNQPDPDITDYKKSYAKIRMFSLFAIACAFLLYAFFIDKTTGADDGVAYRLGSAFGIFLIIALPASFISALLAIVVDTKFPYKERLKKIFWTTSLWLSVLLIFCIGLIVAMERNLF